MRFQPTSFRKSLRFGSGKLRPKPHGQRLCIEHLENRIVLANVTLSIPTNMNVVQGGVVAVPVRVDQMIDGTGNLGMSQAGFAINYDPSVLSVSGSDIHLGTAPVTVASLFTATPTFASGQLGISLTSSASAIQSIANSSATAPLPSPRRALCRQASIIWIR